MIRPFTAVFACMLVMLSPMAFAEENEASRASAGQLADLLRDYESYQADFIQIVVDDSGREVQETRGELKASRPGRFYWETGAPLKQFIVSDGDTVEVYDPDLEQVTIHQLDDQVQSTPALLLSGEVDNLNETYQVYQRGVGSEVREFRLIPRSQDSLFTSLRLSFSGGVLQEMRMEDSLGQLSILSFDNITLNEAIDDSVFRLDYPEDVDVIRDTP